MGAEAALHVAIIPDGNRRWARARMFQPWKGHEHAVENFRTLTEWCRNDPRIAVMTVWCFSTENWRRDPEEIRKLMTMLEDYLKKEREGFREKRIRFCHSGRTDRIPPSLATLMQNIAEETKDIDGLTLHLALDYGGKDELLRAMKKLNDPASVTDESFRTLLDHPEIPDIDLIIRTSGESRTSNFFLWQSTYAEWFFIEKHFPDFTKEDLAAVVDKFSARGRRFGA
jgi:undecaprenyl diphosphate synthase